MLGIRLAVGLVVVLGLASCGADSDPVMPDVTGQTLDVAQSDIERAGFPDDVEVLGGGLFGVVDESNWLVCDQSPAAGQAITAAPRLTVDRSCGGDASQPSESPSQAATADPTGSGSEGASTYEGPEYETVTVDREVGPARLSQFWAVTEPLDYSTDSYKDQVRLIVSDIARKEGTSSLIVEVVTDREIAEAEAASTYEAFVEEYGEDYAQDTIPRKEVEGWAASYTGGYDSSTGEPSDSDDAFEIIWRPASDNPEFEKWRPQVSTP